MPDALHDALAATFRAWPRNDDDTLDGLRLSDAVRVAHQAASTTLADLETLAADAEARAQAAEEAHAAVTRAAAAQRVRDAAASEQRADALAADLAIAQAAAGRHSQRLALLEALYVQAKARWDHEGGPDALRDAIHACEPARG